jgi:hypothetical protein
MLLMLSMRKDSCNGDRSAIPAEATVNFARLHLKCSAKSIDNFLTTPICQPASQDAVDTQEGKAMGYR